MGRSIIYKILQDILENTEVTGINTEIIEALMHRNGGDTKYDFYNNLVWLTDEFHRYCYGDKKEDAQKMEDMS